MSLSSFTVSSAGLPVSPGEPRGTLEWGGAPAAHRTFLRLCDALCGDLDAERAARLVAALAEPDDLAALIGLAERERVQPTLHEALATRHAGLLPKAYRAMLAIRHETNRRQNVALRQMLHELGTAGEAAGLSFLVLKGGAWLLEDDACAPWRQMTDLDVLVEPRQFDDVPRLLEDMGYKAASTSRRFVDNFHHAPYWSARVPVTLEVHRHIGWRHALLPFETLRAHAVAPASGLWLPPPWTRALHAIVHWQIQDHGASRRTLPLKEIVEVARFMARPDVDWPALSAHAVRVGVVDQCRTALAVAVVLLNARAPAELVPDAAALAWVGRALARRASPRETWMATQTWRAGTLWRCEKVAYRCALRGMSPPAIERAMWLARAVRLPLLAWRTIAIAARALVRFGWPRRSRPRPRVQAPASAAD